VSFSFMPITIASTFSLQHSPVLQSHSIISIRQQQHMHNSSSSSSSHRFTHLQRL
jgi:hypothetical protein